MKSGAVRPSLEEVNQSVDTSKAKSGWLRYLSFAGPAFLVAVGYMDPGNWATDIAGGSKYGYSLIWVLLMSNLIAILLQTLSARLGIVRGRDLAQASREAYPPLVNFSLWILAEIAIAACDLAEVIGLAIGLNLLFGLPLVWGVLLAIYDTLLILYLQRKGMRYVELLILSLVALIGAAFFTELFFARPVMGDLGRGFIPGFTDSGALYIAIGIIGATVMPHNLYLHSALVQTRRSKRDDDGIRTALRFNLIDSSVALNIAFLVNVSILVLAAAVFYKNGYHDIAEIQDAYKLLAPLLGHKVAPILFAIALIASGQSSTITGTLAGQIVMEGYLDLRIAPWLRRLITRLLAIVPTLFVIYFFGESKLGALLILSQVILSLQLAFAVIPLIQFVSDKEKMGHFAISKPIKFFAWLSAFIIVSLNFKLVIDALTDWQHNLINHEWIFNFVIIPIVAFTAFLLLYILWRALSGKKSKSKPRTQAQLFDPKDLPKIARNQYRRIAICLDFSAGDVRAISGAVSHGISGTEYFLLHIVETAGARMLGDDIQDYETYEDWRQLKLYGDKLREQGYNISEQLGFGDPKKEIPVLAEKVNAQLLVIGKHGHRGIRDIIFGETINEVRHRVKCPVLVV
jgi:manganese transport protein